MIDLAIRKSNTYVGSYSHLDSWESIGSAEVLSQMSQVDEEDICENTKTVLHVQVSLDDKHNEDTIKQALTASFSNAGCACEHDCCGCWSTYVVDAQPDTKPGHWILTQSSSRNY